MNIRKSEHRDHTRGQVVSSPLLEGIKKLEVLATAFLQQNEKKPRFPDKRRVKSWLSAAIAASDQLLRVSGCNTSIITMSLVMEAHRRCPGSQIESIWGCDRTICSECVQPERISWQRRRISVGVGI
jgi:hypothetical protein